MTPQELKNSILQLAIQGKLVEQRPEEGTGEELFQQIQSEKQRLIEEGKIKKEKPLPEITEDEILFSIPENWKWARIGEAFCIEMGQSPNGSSVSETEDGIEFHQGKVYFGKMFLEVSPQRTSAPTKIAEPGSILLCVRAPVGKINITPRKICIGRGLCSIIPLSDMSTDFVYYLLATYENTFIHKATGTTFVAITGEVVKNQIIPLPPLPEQKRIVAKIEELLPLIDRYEKAWAKLEDFNKRFPLDMQKSLLQMAIQGKLVEQRPEEGTGEELYQQIQQEKQALIKAGKIKKEKPLPEIMDEDVPFDIPDSWKWVYFSDLYKLTNGIASRGSKDGQPHFVLRLADLSKGYIDTSSIREICLTEKEYISHQILCEDLVFIRVNGSKDKVATAFHYNGQEILSYCDHLFCGHRFSDLVYAHYIMYVFNCPSTRLLLMPHIKTTAGQNTISQDSMSRILIPLPPLSEQKRIVNKLEALLHLCEKLKQK